MKTKVKRSMVKRGITRLLTAAMVSSIAFGAFIGVAVSGEVNSESFNAEDLHYFMNEGFSDYQGGIPVGWTTPGLTSSNLQPDNGGVKISENNAKLNYLFPESIKTGEFTIEFKVRRDASDSAWGLRMLDEADVLAEDKGLTVDVNDAKFDKNNNVFIGNSTGLGEENNSKVFVNLGRRGWVGYKADSIEAAGTTEVCGDIGNSTDAFTYVKAMVNIDAGTCKIKVGDGQEYTKTFQTDRFKIRRLKTEDGQPDVISYGIRGLQFFKGKGGSVSYDDIKVYTKSYNMNQDFEGFKSNSKNAHFGWWYASNVNLNITQAGNYIFDPVTDQEYVGLKVYGANGDDSVNKNRVAVTPLNIPIRAGRSFSIEYDLCLSGTNVNSIFQMLTLDKEDLFYASTNTSNNTESQNNVGVDAVADKDYLCGNVIYQEKPAENSSGGILVADGLYARGSNVKTIADGESVDLKIPLKSWHHVKLVVTPEKNTVYVTYNGQTYTAEYANAKSNTDIFGIGINCASKYVMPYIANLNVYENDVVNTISVVGVKADGKEVGNTVDSNTIDVETNQITVDLSNPISCADAIELYHKESVGLKGYVTADKTLSEDKKSVIFSNITGLSVDESLVLSLTDNANGVNSRFDNVERYVNYLKVGEVFMAGKPKLQVKSGDDTAPAWTDVESDTIRPDAEYRMYADIRHSDKAPEGTDVVYIAALYEGSQLKYVKNICWNKTSDVSNVSFELPNDIQYTSVRLFAWSGVAIKPIYTDSVFTLGISE